MVFRRLLAAPTVTSPLVIEIRHMISIAGCAAHGDKHRDQPRERFRAALKYQSIGVGR